MLGAAAANDRCPELIRDNGFRLHSHLFGEISGMCARGPPSYSSRTLPRLSTANDAMRRST